jgi:hypothetical protein
MKKMKMLVLLVVLVVAAAGVAAIAGEEKTAVESTRGTVTSVETDAATFTVEPGDGSSLTFHVNDQTKIVRDGKEAGLEELTTGEVVSVSYKKEDTGRYVAVSVGIG